MTKKLNYQALFYLAMHTIMHNDSVIKDTLPELIYTMDENTLVKFLTLFGGRTIQVPTLKEVATHLLLAVCIYYIEIHGRTWEYLTDTYKIPKDVLFSLKDSYERWRPTISDEELELIKTMLTSD